VAEIYNSTTPFVIPAAADFQWRAAETAKLNFPWIRRYPVAASDRPSARPSIRLGAAVPGQSQRGPFGMIALRATSERDR